MLPLAPIAIGCACVGALLYSKRQQRPSPKKGSATSVAKRAPSAARAPAEVDTSALGPDIEFELPFDTDRIDRWAWDLYKQGYRGDALIIGTLRNAYPVTNFGNPLAWPTRVPPLRRFQVQVRDRVVRLERGWNRI